MKLDYAFGQMIVEDKDDDETYVAEVRRIFFNFLKPFLVELPKYFREEEYINNLKEQEKVFSKYFD